MAHGHTRDIPLAQARELIQKAIDKAEQLGLRGGLLSWERVAHSSRRHAWTMAGLGGMARARSKAWISGTQQIPSAEHLKRMNFVSPPVEQGFKTASPEALFPGAGGMPIRDGDEVIAGIAASGATVSPFFPQGIAQENMIADGQPANPEDLLIAYALGIPYVGQHGDDVARWNTSFGEFPADAPTGLGMAPAPRATHQFEHDWAITFADEVIAEAGHHGVRVAIAIVDHRGDPIQQDVMDGAATAGAFVSLAVAATAATFQISSAEVSARYGSLFELAAALPYPILGTAGGVPVSQVGAFIGGLGVAGAEPALSEEIALAALARMS